MSEKPKSIRGFLKAWQDLINNPPVFELELNTGCYDIVSGDIHWVEWTPSEPVEYVQLKSRITTDMIVSIDYFGVSPMSAPSAEVFAIKAAHDRANPPKRKLLF